MHFRGKKNKELPSRIRKMWPNFVGVISLLCLAFFAWASAGPVPIVNEVSGGSGVNRSCIQRHSRGHEFGAMTLLKFQTKMAATWKQEVQQAG